MRHSHLVLRCQVACMAVLVTEDCKRRHFYMDFASLQFAVVLVRNRLFQVPFCASLLCFP
jgi:hypothetical protein